MRIILVALSILLFLILSLPAYFVLWLVGRSNPMKKAIVSQKIVARAFRFVLFCAGTKITVLGKNNVPKGEAVLYASNHRGLADVPVGYITLSAPTGFVAKKEMLKFPIFCWWMKNMNCIFLDRNNMREGFKAILKGIENIKNGYSMFIMPEGTRSQKEELLPFKEGSLSMAVKTGCAIIPVAITNTDAVFERQLPWVKKARVVIHYGSPVYPTDIPPEKKKFIGAFIREIVSDMLNQDKSLIK